MPSSTGIMGVGSNDVMYSKEPLNISSSSLSSSDANNYEHTASSTAYDAGDL